MQTVKTKLRLSVSIFYFIQGISFASWASRIPDIKASLMLNDAQLGSILLFIPIGQISVMALSGYCIGRFGSKLMLRIGAVLYPTALLMLGLATSKFSLSLGLFLFGVAANICNISVNTQGVGVEKIYKRSIMATFHGLWSFGGFIGGLIGMLMANFGLKPHQHFIIILILVLAFVAVFQRTLLPHDINYSVKRDDQTGWKKYKPEKLVIIIGCIVLGCMICEGTMYDWTSVYFASVVKPKEEYVRLGYICAMCAMTVGRFTADRLVTRFGIANVIRTSGAVISVGLLIAIIFPYLITASLGFLLVGAGVSSVVPLCYSMVSKSKYMKPSSALTVASTIGMFGFLAGPPMIGFLSHAFGLRLAFVSIALFGIITSVLAGKLKKY